MAAHASATRRPARGPAILYVALSAVVAVVIVLMGITARPPSPPAVGETAPAALDVIKSPPPQQAAKNGKNGTADNGSAGGLGAAGASPTSSAGTPSPTGKQPTGSVVPSFFDCGKYGDPPRQWKDPQSPPCIAGWQGNNGGATSRGVTGDTIYVAIFGWSTLAPVLQDFLNSHFVFYGRHVKVIDVDYQLGTSGGNPQTQRQLADAIAGDNVFAEIGYQSWDGGSPFFEELAHKGVIGIDTGVADPVASDPQYAPFLWSYILAADKVQANMGEWVCNRLAGHPAAHAGSTLQTTPRKFGIIQVKPHADDYASLQALTDALAACNISTPAPVVFTENDSCQTNYCEDQGSTSQVDATNAVQTLKGQGVTSVICLCRFTSMGGIFRAGSSQAFFPEWLVSDYENGSLTDPELVGEFANEPDQASHMFGISFQPKTVALAQQYWWQAVGEMGAQAEIDSTFGGREQTSLAYSEEMYYKQFLLLASGIQMAGPSLTPQTFASGLHRTEFPNAYDPTLPGMVSFQDGGYSMEHDATELWWNPSARGPYSRQDYPGWFCYAEGGKRHSLGDWPHDSDPSFASTCTTG